MTHEGLLAEVLLRSILGDEVADSVLGREGMASTPERMAKALRELTSGYGVDVSRLLTTFPADGADEAIVIRDVPFSSLCEHHILPFRGVVSVAYLPTDRIVGLSKVPRIIRALSRRLQVQERLTMQIADALEPLKPRGVAVLVRGVHECAELRGVETRAEMVTSVMRGAFKDDARARAEVLALFRS